MQRALCGLFLSFLVMAANAEQALLEMARADISGARNDIVLLAMDLTPAQQKVFWPIYQDYAKEQDTLLVQRMTMLEEFSANFGNMTADHANRIADQSFAIQRARLQRRENYFARISKALDPILAARFIQVDSQVSTLLDFELMKSTPLIAPPPPVDNVEVVN
ncbi:hypothetical protein EYC98_09915 [Halieaceae bacterium IMCC14734]|uniref:LTXXQ motif family protein n=1 Tax=Candidatus Litorirhabdus singularis TaxID=2518993 RepID=A0ABT3TG53_9GAMM|nr:hypothetical protein [Candidatus Litorirhabdus singularis]MCX2981180.1 hypothetical protein [Candidatus Litorirhabdus singularis]